jgi:predicted metal-binding membrane protein
MTETITTEDPLLHGPAAIRPRTRPIFARDAWITVVLLLVAAGGWAWSVITARSMSSTSSMDAMSMTTSTLSLGAFLVAWVAMMAAMMLPAVLPVIRLYAHAAGRGLAAPVPVFAAGYLLVWSAIGLPAFVAWRALSDPLSGGAVWAARLAGGILLLAAVYQVSPLKAACLRHCRSPLGFFLGLRGNLAHARTALAAGAGHGLVCLGCCWALMAVLVALGTMSIPLMLAVAVLIFAEKNVRGGERIASAAAGLLGALGVVVLVYPQLAVHLS